MLNQKSNLKSQRHKSKTDILLLKVKLDGIEPSTWGGNDSQKRNEIRKAIRRIIPEFGEAYIEHLLKKHTEVGIILNCYLKSPITKDIDNLAKVPIDAIFYSAKKESGECEIGYTNKWESKISLLSIKKIISPQNALEVMIYGMSDSP